MTDDSVKLLEYRLEWLDKQMQYELDQSQAHINKASDHVAKYRDYLEERDKSVKALRLLKDALVASDEDS